MLVRSVRHWDALGEPLCGGDKGNGCIGEFHASCCGVRGYEFFAPQPFNDAARGDVSKPDDGCNLLPSLALGME